MQQGFVALPLNSSQKAIPADLRDVLPPRVDEVARAEQIAAARRIVDRFDDTELGRMIFGGDGRALLDEAHGLAMVLTFEALGGAA